MYTLPVLSLSGLRPLDALGLVFAPVVYILLHRLRRGSSGSTTRLSGPPSTSYIFGVTRTLFSPDTNMAALIEGWAAAYGSVFAIPAVLGSTRVVLADPKAILHFYSRETYGYVQSAFSKIAIENIIGRGLIYAEGDDHKRQRKALSPAFSNAAIRSVTSVFFDSGYKVKTAWDAALDASSSDSVVIDVQGWMSRVSLDSIGIAGFSHDFGTLEGRPAAVAAVFEAFQELKPSVVNLATLLLGSVFPLFTRVPTAQRMLARRLNASMGAIGDELLENMRREKAGATQVEDKSIIGLLIKSEGEDAELRMSPEEVQAQMKVLILAGYETTSISLTWALIELCRQPALQTKLRASLAQYSSNDPTWDQLTSALPYLDAVTHEVLRLHPPVEHTTRTAAEADVFPLSAPVRLADGTLADRVHVARGQLVMVPISAMNQAEALWGADAKAFSPERWLADEGVPRGAREIQGHRHLLTFVDGPRMCLGRGFALAEFKAVLSVLIRNFVFELRDGPETQIELVRGLLPRARVAGEPGAQVPMRIRRAC